MSSQLLCSIAFKGSCRHPYLRLSLLLFIALCVCPSPSPFPSLTVFASPPPLSVFASPIESSIWWYLRNLSPQYRLPTLSPGICAPVAVTTLRRGPRWFRCRRCPEDPAQRRAIMSVIPLIRVGLGHILTTPPLMASYSTIDWGQGYSTWGLRQRVGGEEMV